MKPKLKPFRTFCNPIAKEYVSFVKTADESNNRHTWLEVLLPPGSRVPLHTHTNFDKTFTCLEGELSLQIGKKQVLLKPGEYATAIARTAHQYSNHSTVPCRFKCVISPGAPGLEQAIQIACGLARDGLYTPQAKSLFNLLVRSYLWDLSEMQAAGLFKMVNPLLRWLANRAKASGLATTLQRKYVHTL